MVAKAKKLIREEDDGSSPCLANAFQRTLREILDLLHQNLVCDQPTKSFYRLWRLSGNWCQPRELGFSENAEVVTKSGLLESASCANEAKDAALADEPFTRYQRNQRTPWLT